jgi:hypothetical protein
MSYSQAEISAICQGMRNKQADFQRRQRKSAAKARKKGKATSAKRPKMVYLWEAVDLSHRGKAVYKVGVTTRGVDRVRECASFHQTRYNLLALHQHSNALELEAKLLRMGKRPKLKGNGGSEFRTFLPQELSKALRLIKAA